MRRDVLLLTTFFVAIGLADAYALYLSNFEILLIALLSLLSFLSAAALQLRSKWLYHVTLATCAINEAMVVSTLYANFAMLGPSLANLALLIWAVLIVVVGAYLVKMRSVPSK